MESREGQRERRGRKSSERFPSETVLLTEVAVISASQALWLKDEFLLSMLSTGRLDSFKQVVADQHTCVRARLLLLKPSCGA